LGHWSEKETNEQRKKEEIGEMFVIIIVIEFYCLRHDALDNSMSLKYIKLNENKHF
jgi:hypothetical protein